MPSGDQTNVAAVDAGVPTCPAITALVPCYNEVECISRTYSEIRPELSRYGDIEILFVDDGSTDGTLAVIKDLAEKDPCVRWISFSRNFGLEAAFTAGFRYASKPWTVQLDADLQSPPSAMHSLILKALEGYDVVFGVREDRKDRWYRRAGSTGYQYVARTWLGIEVPRGASTFRVARTSVAKKIVQTRLSAPYFIATAPLLGARFTTVRAPHQPRRRGVSKWKFRQLVGHAMDLFVGFSFRPLAAVYLLAAASLGVGGCALVLAATGTIDARGIATVLLVMTIATLLSLGIMARYLVRLMRAQAGPPLFLIRDSNVVVLPSDSLYEHEQDGRVQAPDAYARVA